MKTASLVLALCAISANVSAAPAAAPSLSHAVKQGYDVGFHDCAGALDGFVRFIHDDDEHYAFFGKWSTEHPNDETFNSLTSESFNDGKGLTSFTAVRDSRGKCDVTFTQMLIIPDTICAKIRTSSFKDWKEYGELNGDKIYEDPTSANADVVLTPIGQTGCVIVKNVVAFGLEPGSAPAKK